MSGEKIAPFSLGGSSRGKKKNLSENNNNSHGLALSLGGLSPSSGSKHNSQNTVFQSVKKRNDIDLSKYPHRFTLIFKEAFDLRNEAHTSYRADPSEENSRPISLLKKALSKIQEILLEGPNDFQALFFCSQTHLDLAFLATSPSLALSELSEAQKKADSALKSSLSESFDLSNGWALLGLIHLCKAQRHTTLNERESSENALLDSTEYFQKCLSARNNHPVAAENLAALARCFRESPKQRERSGNAIYFISGELIKQGGGYKNWKSRWVVCDDTGVAYYQGKKDWDSGPVSGKQGTPKGQIQWNEIVDVTYHEGECHNIHNRPKNCTKLCLHILTKNRTYNIIGFQNYSQLSDWFTSMKRASRLAKAKAYLKKQSLEHYSIVQDSGNRLSVVEKDDNISHEKQDFFTFTDALNFIFPNTLPSPRASVMINPSDLKAQETEGQILSYEDTFSCVRTLTPQLQKQLTKQILTRLENEGKLSKLFLNLIGDEESAPFLESICDISNFKTARFGVLNSIQKLLETSPYSHSRKYQESDSEEDSSFPPPPSSYAPSLPSGIPQGFDPSDSDDE